MLYTYYSGRDAQNIYAKIQSTVKEVNGQVEKISDDTKKISETLARITDGVQIIISAILCRKRMFLKKMQEEF